jgi:SAM-dependent methyltransferase
MMQRLVEPEWLDELPAEEPHAIRSRSDLRRLNWFMNHAALVARAFASWRSPQRVLDLGCGDGAFALRLAKRTGWRPCEFVLVDRNPSISQKVRDGFAALDCPVTVLPCDVLTGLEAAGETEALFANLFLHHFDDRELARLLADIAVRCRTFVACEPRRSASALFASRLVGLLGCNAVTRHDAPASVRAGFFGPELSRLWPDAQRFSLEERPAGLFSHLFVARKL